MSSLCRQCNLCKQALSRDAFSKRQWKKKQRICRECIDANRSQTNKAYKPDQKNRAKHKKNKLIQEKQNKCAWTRLSRTLPSHAVDFHLFCSQRGELLSLEHSYEHSYPLVTSTSLNKLDRHQQWEKVRDYNLRYREIQTAIDDTQSTLHIMSHWAQISKIDFHSKEMSSLPSKALEAVIYDSSRTIACVGTDIHMIGDHKEDRAPHIRTRHYVLNSTTGTVTAKQIFDKYFMGDDQDCMKLLSIKSRNRLILAVPATEDFDGRLLSPELYTYCLLSDQWEKMKIEIPFNLYCNAAVVTSDDRYIIFVGGGDDRFVCKEADIWIYDVQNNSFLLSLVKCPKSQNGCLRAVIRRDPYHDELATFGYIRRCFASDPFAYVQRLPDHLMQLIGDWVCFQELHLMKFKKHWKIDLEDVLQPM